ncbi:hypothetical protein ACTFIR_012042 [Dictyostelium discoideum]
MYKYISNYNSEIISNLFKILEFNYDTFFFTGYRPKSQHGESKKKCSELYFNNLSTLGSNRDIALFDPDNSGQQVESIKVKNEYKYVDYVEARHLIKVNQFENLHSIEIPINSFQILSNLSKEMGYFSLDCIKSDLEDPIDYDTYYDDGDIQTFINNINQPIELYSNSFQPLFSELNTSIERIELDCVGLLNINTFSNLLKNKSIKYLCLYDSDFIAYSSKPSGGSSSGDSDDGGSEACQEEIISINQYLFDNIFSSPLTSIRHSKIKFKELKQLKFIFNLILNNIFKLQLYSLIFELNGNELVTKFIKEFKNLNNYISTQEQQKSNNIYLKEIKIKVLMCDDFNYDLLDEINNNINSPYFTTIKEIY